MLNSGLAASWLAGWQTEHAWVDFKIFKNSLQIDSSLHLTKLVCCINTFQSVAICCKMVFRSKKIGSHSFHIILFTTVLNSIELEN